MIIYVLFSWRRHPGKCASDKSRHEPTGRFVSSVHCLMSRQSSSVTRPRQVRSISHCMRTPTGAQWQAGLVSARTGPQQYRNSFGLDGLQAYYYESAMIIRRHSAESRHRSQRSWGYTSCYSPIYLDLLGAKPGYVTTPRHLSSLGIQSNDEPGVRACLFCGQGSSRSCTSFPQRP